MTIDNPILQRAIDHFKAHELRIIEVPEWGDNGAPLTVYARPMNMMEKNVLARSSDGSDLGVFVDLIIMKAENADGEKLFTKADKPHFMRHVDADVISRVAGELLETDTVDDRLGNSGTMPSDSS